MEHYNDLVGKIFRRGGVVFEISSTEFYPEELISAPYKKILEFQPGIMVAIKFRGTLIPNIVLEGRAVARITSIRIGDQVLDRPGKISAAISIEEDMLAYEIVEIC